MKESRLEVSTKRNQRFYKPIDAQSVTYAIDNRVSSINIGNILNQLGKHDFFCG